MNQKSLREKYPDKVPVVLKRNKGSKHIKDIGVVKYLVQDYITVSQFMYIIRKKIKIDSTEALYLYANEQNVLNNNLDMIAVYNEYKSDDGLLKLTYAGENVFG